MSDTDLGYSHGTERIRPYGVAAGAAIVKNQLVKLSAAGFIEPVAAGDISVGWAKESITGGAADGDAEAQIDTSIESVYRCLASAAPTAAVVLNTCDAAGPQTADLAASANGDLFIEDFDADSGHVYIRRTGAGLAGVP